MRDAQGQPRRWRRSPSWRSSLVAGCTSDPDEAGSGEAERTPRAGRAGSTTGLTDDTIRIGYIGADFGALAEAGLAPDLGDQPKIVQSVVDQINEDGGIDGRQVEMRHPLVDGTDRAQAGQAACLEMTQDFGAFAVVLAPVDPAETARCTAVTNETLTLGATGFDQALYDEAEGRLFTTGSDTSMSTDRQYAGWARLLDDEGELDGKTIGVVTAEQSPEFVAAAEDGADAHAGGPGPRGRRQRQPPVPERDRDCDQQEAAVQQMKDAGVDLVFMAAANLIGPTVRPGRQEPRLPPAVGGQRQPGHRHRVEVLRLGEGRLGRHGGHEHRLRPDRGPHRRGLRLQRDDRPSGAASSTSRARTPSASPR